MAGASYRAARGGVLGILCMLAMLISGCAVQTHALLGQPSGALPRRAELTTTPFFPQERYQCGPAALAMSLTAAGIARSPESLVPQVYVPQRMGSLPPEMLAAARRSGAFAITIPPRLDALLAEVSAGHPVVVLQNLGLAIAPVWHYAVVVGYDLDQGEIILRSGITERLAMRMSTFEHTWGRSGFWGMLALPPGRLPTTADADSVVKALLAFEKSAAARDARTAYEAAKRRWPANLTIQLGSGNAAYAAGDLQAAADAFKDAIARHPDSVPALNNYASVMAKLGRLAEAQAAAERAVDLGGPLHDAALATLASIQQQRSGKRQ